MNIVVYKGECPRSAPSFHVDQMIAVFIKLGAKVTVVDLTEKDWTTNIIPIFEKGCDFVFALNVMGSALMIDDKAAYDVFDIPYVSMTVDHPCLNLDRLNVKMNRFIVTCIDKAHLDFLSLYFPEEHFKVKTFLPHGGTIYNSFQLEETLEDYLERRTIPLLFAGSFRPPQKTWQNNLPPHLSRLFDDITDCILTDESLTMVEAYNYVIKQRGMELSGELSRKIYPLFGYIDIYLRGYWRQACLEALAKAQIPLFLCCGCDWDEWLARKKFNSITCLGELDYDDLLDNVQKTRLYLDTPNNYFYGSHERNFNAMLNGAVAVTQANNYYPKEFTDEKDIIFYQMKHLDRLPQKITQLLENPESCWQIAKIARKKTETKHCWFNRAEEILNIVSAYKKSEGF